MSRVKRRRRFWQTMCIMGLLMGGLFGVHTYKAFAQVDIAKIVVIETRLNRFPEYEILLRFLNSHNRPVTEVSPDVFRLSENGHSLSIDIEPVQGPLQVFLVFDAGAGIRSRYQGRERALWMKSLGTEIVQSLAEYDGVGVILATPSGPQVLQSLTSDRDLVLSQLQRWSPVAEQRFSPGLEGVRKAIEEFAKVGSQYPRIVVFFTAGIQIENNKEAQILNLARQYGVVVYVFNLHPSGQVIGYQSLVAGTQGRILSVKEVGLLLDEFRLWRSQFLLKARSRTASPQRELKLEVRGRPESTISWMVSLDTQLQSPLVSMVLNQGQEHLIVRVDGQTISPDVIPVEVQVQWQDPYPRRLSRVELWVNGELYGSPKQNVEPSEPVVFHWKIEPNAEAITFIARVIDELGLRSEIEKVLTLEVEQVGKQDFLCRSLPSVPTIGKPIQSFVCGTLGMGFAEMMITVLLLVVAIIGFRKREYVKEVAVQLTEAVARVTKTFGRRKAKARLVLVEGQDEDGQIPDSIDLYGETTIGRDPQYADIIIYRPAVSRLHCALHEDLNTGQWTIEDKDSTNGTFLNGRRLEPLQPHPLRQGDVIEIAPVYRGGVKFRFEILEGIDVTSVDVFQSVSFTETEEVEQTREVTQDMLQESPSGSEQSMSSPSLSLNIDDVFDDLLSSSEANEEDGFDPSRADF